MRMIQKICLLLATVLLCAGLPASAQEEAGTQLFVINVGKGDAIVVMANGKNYLIDAGLNTAWGALRSALTALQITRLDGVFLTHADADHVGGMPLLAETEIEIGAWFTSAYCEKYTPDQHPFVQAATRRGQAVNFLKAGDSIDGVFTVLAPFVPDSQEENNNSLVMMLTTADGQVLLTGDMELPEEAALLAAGTALSCDVLKVANHADGDASSAELIGRTGAQLALISTSSYDKPGTPDPDVMSALQAAGMNVYETEKSGSAIHVTLASGTAAAEYVTWSGTAAYTTDVSITSAVPGDDLITLHNASADAIDLSGWYLYSTRGEEMFVFAANTQIAADDALIVGSYSSASGAYDILWPDKKIIHKSKEDTICLYDAAGRLVSAY